MGSDNLFHKRKAQNKPPRHNKQRKPRYLIVCEGSKTEPNYLKALIESKASQHRDISNFVKVARHGGSAPISILEAADKFFADERDDPYDTVYCVYDRDQHETFNAALGSINELNERYGNKDNPTPFVAITTTPCFEFWLLLHFDYIARPFKMVGKKSSGKQVVDALKKIELFRNYSKGQTNSYELLIDRLDAAKQNAERLRSEMNANGCNQSDANPWTNFDELVEAIQNWPHKHTA